MKMPALLVKYIPKTVPRITLHITPLEWTLTPWFSCNIGSDRRIGYIDIKWLIFKFGYNNI